MSHPTLYWAQDKKVIYIQIALMGATEVKCDIENEKIVFSAKATSKTFAFEFPLNKAINKDGSRFRVLGQSVEVLLQKKEDDKESWKQINKGGKLPFVRIDWNRWQEDEEEKPKSEIPKFDGTKLGSGSGEIPKMDDFKLPDEKKDEKKEEGCHCHECHEHEHECKDDCKCKEEKKEEKKEEEKKEEKKEEEKK